MKYRYVALVAVLAATVGVMLMHMVAPMSIGPFDVLAFFLCLYVVTTSCCYLVIATVKHVVQRAVRHNAYRGLVTIPPLKLYYYASIVGLIPIILLGMQSLGGVTAWDILLLALFLSLGCFYIHKRF